MKADEFKALGPCVARSIILPLHEEIQQAEVALAAQRHTVFQHQKYLGWCTCLTAGEELDGSIGLFVRRYQTERATDGRMKLLEADFVIVPDVITPHELPVSVPDPSQPGWTSRTMRVIDANGIVERMQEHARRAPNVTIGTMDHVLREPCDSCGLPALVVGMDEYIDETNGWGFTIGRLCGQCSLVHDIAYFVEYSDDPTKGGRTDRIYRTS